MSQKGVLDRKNDISIIIGNLPKRLQKKIADSSIDFEDERNRAKLKKAAAQLSTDKRTDLEQNATAVDSLAFGVNGVGDYGNLNRASNLGPDCAKNRSKCEDNGTFVPGLLFVKPTDVGKSTNCNQFAYLENFRRMKRQQYSQTRCETSSIISPARVVPKSTAPLWFHTLDMPFVRDLTQLHDTFTNLMHRNAVLQEWDYFIDTHMQLKEIYMRLQLNHLKLCCEQKVDTFFWKLLFYNAREHLKMQLTNPQTSEKLLYLLDVGLEFYKELLDQLSAKFLTTDDDNKYSKYETIAKVAAQKMLICLGDLSRYKIKQVRGNNYAEAVNYYQRAQKLIPSNGIPYNQLAIVAICAHKKFDAVYFHMRSLLSSNSIHSARESLLVLFDEICRKYEETELKNSPIHQSNLNGNRANKQSTSLRKEVWIYPDGERRLHRTEVNKNYKNCRKELLTKEEKRLSDFSSDELLRRFISLYCYIIGKFYTGIGMESVQFHQRKLLTQLDNLLNREDIVWQRSKLLKIVALNIFIVDHNSHKEIRREILYYVFTFCNQMFGLFLRRCNRLLMEYRDDDWKSKDMKNILKNLNTFLLFAKVYMDWLTQNIDIWEPIRNEEHTYFNYWSELEKLFSLISEVMSSSNCDALSIETDVPLEEDNFFIGFTPIQTKFGALEAYKTEAIINKSSTEHHLSQMNEFYCRLKRISQFKETFDVNSEKLRILETSNFVLENLNGDILTALKELKTSDTIEKTTDDENSENIAVNIDDSNAVLTTKSTDAQLAQLTKLKKELEAKTNVKKLYNAKLEEILKFLDTTIYIEVRPKYLLPDTNCFIDCLEDFEKLVKDYVLVVPLTVIKELDGLSKGVKLESFKSFMQNNRIHHFDDVSTRAKKSLSFLKTSKHIRCATTKGSFISSSLFALVEEEHVSNDDKILATALSLSKTMSTETNRDGKCLVQTELVLITSDRNLRVKALSRNLAASELNEFLQWANFSNS